VPLATKSTSSSGSSKKRKDCWLWDKANGMLKSDETGCVPGVIFADNLVLGDTTCLQLMSYSRSSQRESQMVIASLRCLLFSKARVFEKGGRRASAMIGVTLAGSTLGRHRIHAGALKGSWKPQFQSRRYNPPLVLVTSLSYVRSSIFSPCLSLPLRKPG
jgi:hypothetical protein